MMRRKHALIVGLGVTGLSVARYLLQHNIPFDVADHKVSLSDDTISKLPALREIAYFGGGWDEDLLAAYEQLIVSPGISTRDPLFAKARESGVEIIGDVELFARAVKKPVVAVTGSNGKSTVVSMIGELLSAAGRRVAVIGNVGLACLDGLSDDMVDVYVLELSSFQLETTFSLTPAAACVLNVSEDHLDRYHGIEDYAEVKRRIYRNAGQIVYNLDDARTHQPGSVRSTSFSSTSTNADWYLKDNFLCGPKVQIDVNALAVAGGHNRANALAAMALASVVTGIALDNQNETYAKGLSAFGGLPHRSELICSANNVRWFNDSKGTNVGACISAIEGMDRPVVLIAGGRGKNSDYSAMKEVVQKHCRAVILLGEDAQKISSALDSTVPVFFEQDMKGAVNRAESTAQAGDCVLLSPACASFDMFENFEVRGAVFSEEVRKRCA